MRLTIRTNLAMRILMVCAANPNRIVRKTEIARTCNASENHLAQVIQTLAHRGFIKTVRGRAGGMRLARPAEAISVGEVVRDLEAEVPFTECFHPDRNTCPLTDHCRLKGTLAKALDAFYATLDGVKLHTLVRGNDPLLSLLRLEPPERLGTRMAS